jgi:hypothetical protein
MTIRWHMGFFTISASHPSESTDSCTEYTFCGALGFGFLFEL